MGPFSGGANPYLREPARLDGRIFDIVESPKSFVGHLTLALDRGGDAVPVVLD